MQTLSIREQQFTFAGSPDPNPSDWGSWMPWNLISDLSREMGHDFGHWWNGTYSGSQY